MNRFLLLAALAALFAFPLAGATVRTATEPWVTNKVALAAADVLGDAQDYTDTSVSNLEERVETALAGKQSTIDDLSDIRAGAALGATALQSYTETDPTVPAWAKSESKPAYSYSEISGKPNLATVATSGSYDDLSDKPTIPSVPANVSAFANDAGYLTQHQSLANYATKTEVAGAAQSATNYTDAAVGEVETDLAGYAANLRDLGIVYNRWTEDATPNNRAGGYATIYFRPSVFGMTNNSYIRSFKLRSSDNSQTLPTIPVYAKIIDPNATASALAVSQPVMMSATDTDYEFHFDRNVLLTSTKQYWLVFCAGAADGSTAVAIGVRLAVQSQATDLYYNNTTWRPIMSVLWSDGRQTSDAITSAVPDISTKADYSTVSNLQSQVTTIVNYLEGDDARVVITNFDSQVEMPTLLFERKVSTNEWQTIWDERTRWNTNAVALAAIHAELDALDDAKADRAWGAYDSSTGNDAPSGYTWISSPHIALSGGYSFEKHITTMGGIYLLENNGLQLEVDGVSTNSYFKITDDNGDELFAIVKGDKRIVGAEASDVETSGASLIVLYNIVSAEHPVISCCLDLSTHDWKEETDQTCSCTVAWSGQSGAWVATLTPKSATDGIFAKAEVELGGDTYIKNTAPTMMSRIILNGVTYQLGTATISGQTVLTLTEVP